MSLEICKDCLERMSNYFKKRKHHKLRALYSKILNEYLQSRNLLLLDLAVLSYVLSKVLSKNRFREKSYSYFLNKIENTLEKLSLASNPSEVKRFLKEIEEHIKEMDEKDKRYIFDLFTKGRVKIAATLYAKGASLGEVSKLLEIPKEEILSYAGKTMMFDRIKEEKTIFERVKELKRLIL